MNVDLDPIVASWLRERIASRPDPDLVLREVLTRLPAVDQRPVWRWSPRRALRAVTRSRTSLLLLALLLVATSAVMAAAFGSALLTPATFAPGSIAFTRGGSLYVSGPDGRDVIQFGEVHDGAEVADVAFSPDREHLAVGYTPRNADVHRPFLDILSPAAVTVGTYETAEHVDSIGFSWAPDGQRLAVYPAAVPDEVGMIGRDGASVGGLQLPRGTTVHVGGWGFEFGMLAWSPDARWIAVPAGAGNGRSACVSSSGEEACYLLAATDGSATLGLSDLTSGYLAWAPDGRIALAHWNQGTVDIWPPDRSSPTVFHLPHGQPSDGHILAWSPDGTRLAVSEGVAYQQVADLVIIEADGTLSLVPMSPFANIEAVAWPIDGQQLLVQGTAAGETGIWSIDPADGASAFLVDSNGNYFDIADGRP